jgi:hypothetical protein
MNDKKIQARNKFVGKINGKIEKLNQDIKLLIEVDQALNAQTGGGLLDKVVGALGAAAAPITTGSAQINYDLLNAEAQTLTEQLATKISTLEKTLGLLLSHISRNTTVDLSQINLPADATKLQSVKDAITRLDTDLDANKFAKFNEIYDSFATGDTAITPQAYKDAFRTAGQLPDSVKDLLHKAILSARQGKSNQPPAAWR